jgi:hypothetical protein
MTFSIRCVSRSIVPVILGLSGVFSGNGPKHVAIFSRTPRTYASASAFVRRPACAVSAARSISRTRFTKYS